MINIEPADFEHPAVQDLLRVHVAEARANSPPGTSFALDWSALKAPEITFVAAWEGDQLLGFGALKSLSAGHGEIKSMRTTLEARGRGVGAAILSHLLALARARAYETVSLETGDGPAYAAARGLYRRFGFVEGQPFADYPQTDFNRFFHLRL